MSDQRIGGGGKARKARSEAPSRGLRKLASQSRGMRTTSDAIGIGFDALAAMFEGEITQKEAANVVNMVGNAARHKEAEQRQAMLEGTPVVPLVLRGGLAQIEADEPESPPPLTDEEQRMLALLLRKASASAATVNGGSNGAPAS
jgi:hypothetical protein